MIAKGTIGLIILAYLTLLFIIGWWVHRINSKNSGFGKHPIIYALSLSVYCTAWTYYGNVGKASTDGILFITTFLGPALFIPMWYWLTQKMVRIVRYFRISSLADFISSRYGNSSLVGGIVALFCVIAILPYIAIQLKAIGTGFDILVGNNSIESADSRAWFFQDSNFYLTGILALFIVVFGTRNIETATKNQGLVTVIAFEAIIKLIAFLSLGIFVCFFLFDGPGDLFIQAGQRPELQALFSFSESQAGDWFPGLALSFLAVLFLPRQFQTAVLENGSEKNLKTAVWFFPLYLLLINFFVLPIALGGKLFLSGDVDPDTYVLSIPMAAGNSFLAIFSYIGGFSASASMIMVSAFALTIMISNNLVMPVVAKRKPRLVEISGFLITTRRIGIVVLMFLAYLYHIVIASNYPIVSTGLISFVGVAQLAPAAILGMYWKHGNRKGALTGLITGIVVWVYMLIVPHLIQLGWLPTSLQQEGLFGIRLFRPQGFLGLWSYSAEVSCFVISIFVNTLTYVLVSVSTRQELIERVQAEKFVNIRRYMRLTENLQSGEGDGTTAPVIDLLERVLGKQGTDHALQNYYTGKSTDRRHLTADLRFLRYAEKVLAGAVGTASARILIASTAKEENLSFEDLVGVARESGELLSLNKQLKDQSEVLRKTTADLQRANQKLMAHDREKDLFISTVTHELRTPITSIRSFCEILYDHDDLDKEEQSQFLEIIVRETERISRLISQVLDLESLQSERSEMERHHENLSETIRQAVESIRQVANEKKLELICETGEKEIFWNINKDRITQVIVNLLSNAIKYHDKPEGFVSIRLFSNDASVTMEVSDNGPGMAEEFHEKIFEKFFQIREKDNIKSKGVGLGLAISRSIIDRHNGNIKINSSPGDGTTIRVTLPP